MKALVTGGLGFIGSNFILQLLEKNQEIEITNVDAKFYGSNFQNLINVENNQNYQFVEGNINDVKLMEKLIEKNDIIINFAAESFVDRSISNAIPFLESNVNGVFTILELIKKNKKRFVHISTDEVYGSLKTDSAVEETRFNPSSPYSATKAAAELLINSYTKTYDSDCLITRCTNNYGPRQFAEKLIPKTIILAYYNKKIPIYGTGKNIRDWLYVTDHCSAIEKVLQDGKKGESYNISGNYEIDNITIVKEILSLMNKSEELITYVEDRPGHDFRYSMKSEKIRNELQWSQKIDFKEGIKNTVKWYLDNIEWWKNIAKETFTSTPWKN
jgi:dTDP-glucose 4,6-dehydratase